MFWTGPQHRCRPLRAGRGQQVEFGESLVGVGMPEFSEDVLGQRPGVVCCLGVPGAELAVPDAREGVRFAVSVAEASVQVEGLSVAVYCSLKLAEMVMDVAEAVQRRCLSLPVVPLAVQVEGLLAVLEGLPAVAQSR